MPLAWMKKSEKGLVSQFLVKELLQLETVHQYIQGHLNSSADSASRYPLLGPKRLAPRGLARSVKEALSPPCAMHPGWDRAELLVTNRGSLALVSPRRTGSHDPELKVRGRGVTGVGNASEISSSPGMSGLLFACLDVVETSSLECDYKLCAQ
jgi:hypothetical protein